ncbi:MULTISPECIES: SRPBCC family protein [unclassified Streptomyces]|uniref:SRPBCC family protein n=1 Tax=unclassified Streptomyces TaxID=2593676 RepID=UPI000AA6B947|nr:MULTISPECIES: SRPBCC family protein [unclassified Streptomyces]MCX5146444.1 SRPBCC family protein [Streptomyces sp. NBC_00320]WSN49639.1 SRPBCC family protein [Streptomyces sp. NBC_01296]WSW60946.1 SRPBCC family protein [Streptomyces sp. NBC_00998]
MGVHNVHERLLPAKGSEVGALIDTLASGDDDLLWPGRDWSPMEFDRPLGPGATGGHGPVRYTVAGYAPGRWIRFEFTGPRGFHGHHELAVLPAGPDSTRLHHTLSMSPRGLARITWPLAFRPLHDACLEDGLDRAELACTGRVARPARWSPYVRFLRALAALATR